MTTWHHGTGTSMPTVLRCRPRQPYLAALTRLTSLCLGEAWACDVLCHAVRLPHLVYLHISFE